MDIPVERVQKKLTSILELLRSARDEPFYTQLVGCQEILVKFDAVLEHVEELATRTELIIDWVRQVRSVVYTMEDILVELDETFRGKLTAKANDDQVSGTNNKVLISLIPSCFSTIFNSDAVKLNAKIRSKIEETTHKLQDLASHIDGLGWLAEGRMSNSRERTSTFLVESSLFGMEKDRKAIINLLLTSDEASQHKFSVIPIVGMGGIGKTALARVAYCDEQVWEHFDLRGWVCVSDDFDVVRLTKSILASVQGELSDAHDLDLLQIQLKKKLYGKKFLIVFDDVWKEDMDGWNILCSPLRAGAPGSKLIVTSRSEGVASSINEYSVPPYRLQAMTFEDSVSLFTHTSLRTENFEAHQELKLIGEKLVKNCHGLPLAVKALAYFLYRQGQDILRWEELLERKISDLPNYGLGVFGCLRISYQCLPRQLKQCFAYCSVFPKGYEFEKDDLVHLWMADYLLELPGDYEQMEDFGSRCFDELLSKSFIQQSSSNRAQFELHGLMCELVQSLAEGSYLNLDVDGSEFEDKISTRKFPNASSHIIH